MLVAQEQKTLDSTLLSSAKRNVMTLVSDSRSFRKGLVINYKMVTLLRKIVSQINDGPTKLKISDQFKTNQNFQELNIFFKKWSYLKK